MEAEPIKFYLSETVRLAQQISAGRANQVSEISLVPENRFLATDQVSTTQNAIA